MSNGGMLNMRDMRTGMSYNPNRDIANVGGKICRRAAYGLNKTNWQAWFSGYLEFTGTTEEDLAKAVESLPLIIDSTKNPNVTTARQAVERSNLLECKYPAQLALMARLGESFLHYYWYFAKQVLAAYESPHDMNLISEAAESEEQMFLHPARKLVSGSLHLPPGARSAAQAEVSKTP